MTDFIAALGLVFVIEGLAFAAFPDVTKRALAHLFETPDGQLRAVGVASAIFGLLVIWLARG